MLLHLRAENYAVIDRAEAHFGPGLNLLTGETGTGKSILIDSLALLLGGRASADSIRHGAEKAIVSCLFQATPGAIALLSENGIDHDPEDEGIGIRREISANGKGRVLINNQAATVSVLRLLAPELALVHAQGETLGAFDQAQQRLLLDRSAAIATDPVQQAFTHWQATHLRLEDLLADEQDRLRMADMWRFQLKEIQEAALAGPDEDLKLAAEKRVLANAEKLFTTATAARELLYEAESSAETTLGQALRLVEELARYEPSFQSAVQDLNAVKATVEDLSATLRHFAENVQAGPDRLAEIEDRLAQLDRLKRKYGADLAAVILFGQETARKLAAVEDRDAILENLRKEELRFAAAYESSAAALTAKRTAAARRLERAAEKQINDLAMQVRFAVNIASCRDSSEWSAHGWDRIAFLIATNYGEPLKPLEEIASGGEMSRVMLALKVTVEESAKSSTALPRTLVFDEIDIGIGGRAAEAVGLKLKALAKTQQVLCVTHLPQIAAFADQHFLVEKIEQKGRNHTSVRQMSEPERIREIARMLSGATLTDTSMRHAESMLAASQ